MPTKTKKIKVIAKPGAPGTEVIHGRVVLIGTGTGQRVGKGASEAVKSRKQKLKEAMEGL